MDSVRQSFGTGKVPADRAPAEVVLIW